MKKLKLSLWVNILMGKSYYHQRQGLGKCFDGGTKRGYYNDLSSKTQWKGLVDEEGVPENLLSTGEKVYFPTTITQMALGFYDKWIIYGQKGYLDSFMCLAKWLVKNQDQEGGWDTWSKFPYSTLSRYSAMVQGQAISVFFRAFQVTEEKVFVHAAQRAFNLLFRPIGEGGCANIKNEDIFLEEIPLKKPSTVLNGWIFAIFGAYDFTHLSEEEMAENLYLHTLATLSKNVERYDSGFWSYYDLSGKIASPFYHDLHISLLKALFILTGIKKFDKITKRWKTYENKWLNKSLAITKKIYQKMKSSREEVVITK